MSIDSGLVRVFRRELALEAVKVDVQGRHRPIRLARRVLRAVAPGQELGIGFDIFGERVHVLRSVAYQCRAVDLDHRCRMKNYVGRIPPP
jgi:hypothetical protein